MTYLISEDQIVDMRSGTQFEVEEKITRTEMVSLLLDAKNSVFTCTFRKKVKESDVEELLKNIKSNTELKKLNLAK